MHRGRVLLVSVLVLKSHVALASTYVYVGAAVDGNIGVYTLEANGTLSSARRLSSAPSLRRRPWPSALTSSSCSQGCGPSLSPW